VRAEYKVPGGKLVAAETSTESGIIKKVKISGDFFMHPETAIMDLEATIIGTNVKDLESTIVNFFNIHQIQLVGLGPRDFVYVIRMSLASAP